MEALDGSLGIDTRHTGVVVLPQWPLARCRTELDMLLAQRQGPLEHAFYAWQRSGGWSEVT